MKIRCDSKPRVRVLCIINKNNNPPALLSRQNGS